MSFFNFDSRVLDLGKRAMQYASESFERIDDISEHNQQKVLAAFRDNRVSESHFAGTTGYGYDDRGREIIDSITAQIFGCDDALVRHNFVSGTHALSASLFGILRPGDVLLSVTSKPYDTLDASIGITEAAGSLKEWGVEYRQVEFKDGEIDFEEIEKNLDERVRMVFIQRSKGYNPIRHTLSCTEISKICDFVHKHSKRAVCMLDNCYGEFVEKNEPTEFGIDIMAGSLIKNPGGGMALSGGYAAGRADLVELVSYRQTCPGIGKECGATLGQNGNILRGLFFAPHIVAQALKTAVFCSSVYSLLRFRVEPEPLKSRFDIIQAIHFGDKQKLIAFCQGMQKGAPVDAFVEPIPWAMPGYDSEVIMAAGAFVQGASIELSADAPIKPPYTAYMQGGLTFESGKAGVLMSVQSMLEAGLLENRL